MRPLQGRQVFNAEARRKLAVSRSTAELIHFDHIETVEEAGASTTQPGSRPDAVEAVESSETTGSAVPEDPGLSVAARPDRKTTEADALFAVDHHERVTSGQPEASEAAPASTEATPDSEIQINSDDLTRWSVGTPHNLYIVLGRNLLLF